MSDTLERIELLITRRLDGVLTEDESLELDRAMIRSPEYRQMFDLSARIDAESATALAAQIGFCSGDEGQKVPVSSSGARGMTRPWLWWLMPAAVAACVGWLMFVDVGEPPNGNVNSPLALKDDAGGGIDLVVESDATEPVPYRPAWNTDRSPNGATIRQAGTGLPAVQRVRDSDVYGIVGGEDRIYLIEVDRVRTLRQSPTLAKARPAFHEL